MKSRPKPRVRKAFPWLGKALLLALFVSTNAIILSGCSRETRSPVMESGDKSSDTKNDKTVDAAGEQAEAKRIFKVPVLITTRRSVAEDLVIPGAVTALPDHSAKISPAIAGKLREVLAVSGQTIVRGQVIAKLDDRHLREILEQSRSAVDLAKTNVKQAENGLAFAKENVERQKRLFQAEVSAKKDILSAQSQVATATSQLEAAQSQLRSAQVLVQQNETELSLTIVQSPLTGVIANRYLNAGDTTDPNTPIVQVINLQRVSVNAQLPADSPYKVKVGDRGTIKSAGQTASACQGVVKSISPIVDPATNTIRVQLECTNHNGLLRDGQTVEVAIHSKVNRDAILIPISALVPDPNDPQKEMVYVVDGDTAHRVPVSHTETVGDSVEIVSGIKVGQKVIISGAYGLPDGSKIEIERKSPAPTKTRGAP